MWVFALLAYLAFPFPHLSGSLQCISLKRNKLLTWHEIISSLMGVGKGERVFYVDRVTFPCVSSPGESDEEDIL